jgi:hypothetical protein
MPGHHRPVLTHAINTVCCRQVRRVKWEYCGLEVWRWRCAVSFSKTMMDTGVKQAGNRWKWVGSVSASKSGRSSSHAIHSRHSETMSSQPSHNNRNNADADVDVDQESLGSLKDRFSAAHLPVDIHPRHLASYQRTPPDSVRDPRGLDLVCTTPTSYGFPYAVVVGGAECYVRRGRRGRLRRLVL